MAKFKIGDEVKCIKWNGEGEATLESAGAGWQEGAIFTVASINNYGKNRTKGDVFFFKETDYGVFKNYLELVSRTNMNEFKVGDKVRGIGCDIRGCEGYIVKIHPDGGLKNNEWYEIIITKSGKEIWHTEEEWRIGNILKRKTNWENSLELITPKQKIMNRLTSKLKRLFNPNLQKQYKAGLIDECGDLTERGREELEIIQRDKYDEELTKVAEDVIEEEKENK